MYRDDYDNENRKIPYDDEPIARGFSARDYNQSVRQIENNNGKKKLGFVDIFQFVLCVLLIVAVVMLYGQIDKIGNQRNVYNVDIQAEYSDLAYASAKGLLSTVNIGATLTKEIAVTNDKGQIIQTLPKLSTSTEFFKYSYSLGSGVIYSLDRGAGSAYIITNYHVVANLDTHPNGFGYYYVQLWDSSTPIEATFVGGSYVYDIAVLYIGNSEEVKESSCCAVEVANYENIVYGDDCISIGNSMGRNLRTANGIISVEELTFARSYSRGGTTYLSNVTYLSHSASVNSGNSGGGLYDGNGNLAGIVNAKFRDVESNKTLKYEEVVHGMFYAIPSDIAVSIAENVIRNNGKLVKASTGLEYWDNYQDDYGKKYSELKSYIDCVNPKTEITEKGLKTRCDMIVNKDIGQFLKGDKLISVEYKYNGNDVVKNLNHTSALESVMFNWSKNDTLTFTVERNGEKIEILMEINATTVVI